MFKFFTKKGWTLGLAVLLALAAATPACSQSIWLDKSIDRAIWLEGLKTSFKGDDNFTFTTSIWYLSGRFLVSRGPAKLFVLAEIPFAHGGTKSYYDPFFNVTFPGEGKTTIGNPYFGLEVGSERSSFSGTFGFRPPLVDENADLAWLPAILTDFDRFEAFTPKIWSLTASGNYRYKGPTGFLLQLRAGPAFFVPTESGVDPELYADYSAQAGYQANNLMLLGGLSGRAIITESDLDFGQRTIHQLGFSGSYAFGSFVPGLHFRLPVDDDLDNIVDFVFGATLGYRLP